MGKKKQTQTNTYTHYAPPETQDTMALRQSIDSANQPDTTIPLMFNQQRENVKNRFNNPFGADYSPEVRDAVNYNELSHLDQLQGEAVRADNRQRQNNRTQNLMGLAGMTRPQLMQAGGTVTQSGGVLEALIGAGGGIGQAALM